MLKQSGNLFMLLAIAMLVSACGGGSASANLTSAALYDINGNISGHAGNTGIALTVNNTLATTVTVAPGVTTFSFPSAVHANDAYSISVSTPPTGEDCTVTANASGTVSTDVTGVNIYCSPWLYAHNQLRQQLNAGSLPNSPKPTTTTIGTPVNNLQWDPNLALVAQIYASTCVIGNNAYRTQQYQSLGGTATYVGENIASTTGTMTEQQFLGLWSAEDTSFVYEKLTSTDVTTFGHYSQLIWRNTSYVGCAIASCSTFQFAVCDYAEGGNYLNQYPY